MTRAPEWTAAELEAYLDEALPVDQMALVEQALRESEPLRARLAEVIDERDREGSSLAGIWRKHRLTCPDRGELGAYLLGALPATRMLYLRFHLETVGCRICQANLEDLQGKAAPSPDARDRRRRCFESSLRSLPSPLPSAETE